MYSVPGKQKAIKIYDVCKEKVLMLALKFTLTTHSGWSSVFMLSWRLHMFMVFIVHFPPLWLLSWHASGIQTLQIVKEKIVNTALLGLQNIECALWLQMCRGRSAPWQWFLRGDSPWRDPQQTKHKYSEGFPTFKCMLCFWVFLLMKVDFASFTVAQLQILLRGDTGIRTDPVGFAEHVCIKCSSLVAQPSQAVALVELTNILFCRDNTGPATVGVFQLACCAVKSGDEQEHRGEVFFHVAGLNHVLAGHFDICWPQAWFQAFSSLQKDCVPSMSESGTWWLMLAPFPSTAVSLLSNLVETWEWTQKISSVFWSQLHPSSPVLFLHLSLGQDFLAQLT